MTRRVRAAVAAILVTAVAVVVAGTAGADHAGESITLSQNSGLSDGDTITVTVSGFVPDARPVKLVVAGQGKLVTIPDKLNFDEYAVAPEVSISADGTGTAEFLMYADRGTVQDGTTLNCNVDRCWVIAVQEPFLPEPYYASAEVFFGDNAPDPDEPETTEAPATTEAPETTEAPATTETTEAPEPIDESEEVAAPVESDDDGGSALIWVLLAVAVAAVGGAAFYFTKQKPSDPAASD